MNRKLFFVSVCLLCSLFLQGAAAQAQEAPGAAPFAATAGEPACPGKGGLVKARVVALDQAIWLNRLGATIPNGMIFALEQDVVCSPASGIPCDPAEPLQPGRVMLRPDKRPRPLVLRVNQDQCLEVTFTNLLATTAQNVTTPLPNAENQPTTRAASLHVQGMEWVASSADDGSWVGNNPSSLAAPGATQVYTLYAAKEGTYLLYSTADSYTTPGGVAADGGQVAFGLFGAVHVEPQGAEWYRSQVTADDLKLATKGLTPATQPILDYRAVYPQGHPRAGLPVLNMLHCPNQAKEGCPWGGEIVNVDLTALITGREKDGRPGRFPLRDLRAPVFNPAYALPDRLQPYREVTVIYHEIMQAVQAFNQLYNGAALNFDGNGADNYAFNYGSGGIASEIVANRLGVGPMGNCPTCKYEEFFLTSWVVGDPSMVVDTPANDACTAQGACSVGGASCNPDTVGSCGANNAGKCQFTGYTCDPTVKATQAFYPDDPSNVYHSYLSDHTKFRILHAGPDLHHLHHQHAHQWLHTPDSPNGDYTDSQSLGPGSGFTLEMVYNGSGNVNQTVGDSIFHCHFYPHFAGGMWALWRVHDVFEDGTRKLPDGEITAGTPIPGVVPLPTLAMAPMPGKTLLTPDGKEALVCDRQGNDCVSPFSTAQLDPAKYKNPGYPFFIPGLAGQRAPHPPMDFAKENPDDPKSANLDGGLPRHVVRGCPAGQTCAETPPLNAIDFSKTLENVAAFELPENGTGVERLAMAYHARRLNPSFTPENRKNEFLLNGLPAVPGAPYADPCIRFSRNGGRPEGMTLRRYKGVAFQTDVTFNREGFHFPQQRMLSLWGDVTDTLAGTRPPEPLFFRSNSGECIEYTHANLVPNVYELDDFQVRTPTDILGQHIHLVKFDVTSSDGAANGFNYEDGTFSPDEVSERIRAINAGGGLAAGAAPGSAQKKLTAKAIPFFGAGPGGRWLGAQATIQRWYADPLFDGNRHDPVQLGARDRTLRTVFTHDHYGPSTHQEAGLYAGLVIEPPRSLWYENEKVAGAPFGGSDPATGKPLPGRKVTGPGGAATLDGGPTTWQAVIETPDLPRVSTKRDSFREFLIELQDTTLTYSPFPATAVSAFANQGYCSDTGAACTPATATQPSRGCAAGATCFQLGFCSNNLKLSCKPGTWLTAEDTSGCGGSSLVPPPTCNLVAGIPGQVVAYAPFLPGAANPTVATGIATWGTLPIDPPNKIAAEVIALAGGTNSFSVNYRNEPLYPRINSQKAASATDPAVAAELSDLSFAYRSIDRGPLGGLCKGTSQFCTTNAQCGTGGTCELITKAPYRPLTPDVGPGDPFTPLLRAYAGDDVQIRTLTGGQINPHNFTLHGLKWLAEASFVDSGWRASQTMGISEHFEQLVRVPSWVSAQGSSDYLYMGGAAAIEQAGGNWGLLRAYGARRDDLRPLPQNGDPRKNADAPVCPPGAEVRKYTVVATTAQQALGGPLAFSSRANGASQASAILYFKLEDLNCPNGQPGGGCTAKNPQNPEPLVLRANAGDCLQVTLYNAIASGELPSSAGASSINLPPAAQTNPPGFNFTGITCGPAPAGCLPSQISLEVGLHPQLASFNVTQGDAFNAGNNPVQTVKPGTSRSYTWYAGNIDTSVVPPRYIPIEFGVSNLLPSDVINHYQLGLFGALVIEPRGATGWRAADGISTVVRDAQGGFLFREHVLALEDGVSTSTPLAIGNDHLNAFNYKTEPLANRTCSATGDFSCVLSSTAALCCTRFSSNGKTCLKTAPCGEPQTPILSACAGEQVRLRLVHPGGINTDHTFELFGHAWAETPYMSTGLLGCTPPTTHTNLYASATLSDDRGCTLANLTPLAKLAKPGESNAVPLPLYGAKLDTLSEWQGFRLGHGPSNHFEVLLESAGGRNKVPGDYLYRSFPSMHFLLGPWGIFRVEDATTNPALCAPKTAAGGGAVAAGGAGR